MLCLTQRQSMRFVLIAVGPLAVGVAWLAQQWWERPELPGRILVATLLLALGFESSLAVARARHGLPVVLGARTPPAISSAASRPTASGRWMAAHLPDRRGSSARTIAAIISRGPTRWSWPTDGGRGWAAAANRPGPWSTSSSGPDSPTSCSARRSPKRRSSSTRPSAGCWPPGWRQRSPLFHEEIADADGVIRRYAIYQPRGRILPVGGSDDDQSSVSLIRRWPRCGRRSRRSGTARSATGWRGGSRGRRRFTGPGWRSGWACRPTR